jgi:type IV pilus assembly protein PilX
MNIKRHTPLRSSPRAAQGGAALVVGLILLMVLTLLAISGMNTATVELRMAGNLQSAQNAFQAAEIGIERTLATAVPNTAATITVPETTVPGSTTDRYETVTRFETPNGVTPVPTGGFSMGAGAGFSAYHFDVTSTGTSARDARAVNTQSFYIVGPSGS